MIIITRWRGFSKGQLSLFIFFIFFVPSVLKIISRHWSIGGGGTLGGTSSPPYGPWQTLSVLRPTLRVVCPFCMVWPSFCAVWQAFWAMCLTFCMSNTNFLGFSKGKILKIQTKWNGSFILFRLKLSHKAVSSFHLDL